jgi:hypothetical protein
MSRGWICALAFGLLATASAAAGPAGIPVFNAEDLAPIAGTPWVIASSMAGGDQSSGKLVAIDRRDGSVRPLYPAPGAQGASETPGCRDEVPAGAFKPHGIGYVRDAAGRDRLYVVNHGGRESIEMFVFTGGDAPRLGWIGCAPLPPGPFGNGVAALPDGTVYATNMGKPIGGGKAVSPMGGNVLSWRPGTGWRTVPGSAMYGPNGLVVTPDGRHLYVAAWAAGQVVELTIGKPAMRRTLAVDFLPDNMRWGTGGTLLATGQRTKAEATTDCYLSTRTHCGIPGAFAEIDAAAMTARCTAVAPNDFPTTAIPVGEELWIGSARGDHIARTAPCAASGRR